MRITATSLWSMTLLCILSLFSSCQKEAATIAAKNQEEFSSQDQRMIGERMIDQVREDDHNFPIFASDNTAFDEELNVYLTKLLQTVAISVPVVNRNNFDWGVTVIDAPDIDNMALWLRDLSFSEEEVLAADQYALNVVCPYLYDNEGLRSAIMRLDDVAERTVDWLIRRPGTVKRLELLEDAEAQDCGSNESDFAYRYQAIVARL